MAPDDVGERDRHRGRRRPADDGGGDHRGHDRPDARGPDEADPRADRQPADRTRVTRAGRGRRRTRPDRLGILRSSHPPSRGRASVRPTRPRTATATSRSRSVVRPSGGEERREQDRRPQQSSRAKPVKIPATRRRPPPAAPPRTSGTTGSVHGERIVSRPATKAKPRTRITVRPSSGFGRQPPWRHDADGSGLCSIIASLGRGAVLHHRVARRGAVLHHRVAGRRWRRGARAGAGGRDRGKGHEGCQCRGPGREPASWGRSHWGPPGRSWTTSLPNLGDAGMTIR